MEQQVNTQSSERLFDVSKVDAMLREVKSIGDLTKPGGVIQEMIKAIIERILKAEQEHYLGYLAHEKSTERCPNRGLLLNGEFWNFLVTGA